METTTLKAWTHWKNEKQKRLFLVVDIPTEVDESVVLMEIKFYPPGEKRKFTRVPKNEFLDMTENTKVLLPYVPKV
jgi:hypothetical protein